MEERLLLLALAAVPGLPRHHAHVLLRRFGSAGAVFGRRAAELRAWCAPAAAASLARGPDLAGARAALTRAEDMGLTILVLGSEAFPEPLRSIPDPPLALWLRGRLPQGPAAAIVGARRASPRGREVARRLAAAAAGAGVAVVSGLAYGIDAAAHRGALEAGGASVAVLASGLDRPSPSANLRLARGMLDAGGGWLSEYPPATAPLPFRFPERNRLISGLGGAVLVVEAGEKSGSLWTVRHALDQGRDVLSVPGPVDTASCRGSNRLLRDGAGVILDEQDLLDWLPVTNASDRTEAKPRVHSPSSSPSSPTADLLRALDSGPLDLDELARRLRLPPEQLAPALLDLELTGRIRRDGGRLLRTGR